jgi:hypothetical protein
MTSEGLARGFGRGPHGRKPQSTPAPCRQSRSSLATGLMSSETWSLAALAEGLQHLSAEVRHRGLRQQVAAVNVVSAAVKVASKCCVAAFPAAHRSNAQELASGWSAGFPNRNSQSSKHLTSVICSGFPNECSSALIIVRSGGRRSARVRLGPRVSTALQGCGREIRPRGLRTMGSFRQNESRKHGQYA